MNSHVRILSLLSVMAFSTVAQTVAAQDSEEGAEDFEAVGTPTAQCTYQMGWIVGSYNATQTQDYDPSCVFHFRKPTHGLSVALIGNNHQGKAARTAVLPGPGEVDVIDMLLQDASDNTLADGRRGRQEVTACFLTSDQFKALSAQEQAFRRAANDIYKGCAPQGREAMFYNFTLSFAGGNPERMDAIVMQMHSVNDKDKYCVPNRAQDRDICTETIGKVTTLSPRTEQNYLQTKKAIEPLGGTFESGGHPPLSFRVKDGMFSIVATSSMTEFTPAKSCVQAVNTAEVGKTKTCADTGKTTTVLFRRKMTEDFMPAQGELSFAVFVEWSRRQVNAGKVEVTPGQVIVYYQPPGQAKMRLVDQRLIIGTGDAEPPYFKAGVYRQNGNAEPTLVRLKDLEAMPLGAPPG